MRLDKLISNSTELSRAETHRAIKAQRVCVNDIPAKKASLHIGPTDVVTLDGELIAAPQPRYFMLYKPAGYVCATSDSEHPVVLDLLHETRLSELQIVGRLDIDTTGLLLIADDGDWNHRLTAPSRQCDKIYRVQLRDAVTEESAAQLRAGILLRSENHATLPAEIVFIDLNLRNEVLLTIREGKYHQVKRMFAATGNLVTGLHREQVGEIKLDSDLKPGEYRRLTPAEVSSVT